ncbi:MAG: biotin-dependent carboxyltransferase family protein [Gammaproteobacteria bacterium]|nr:biotin-dependent carboxyltransferase family protein [Gammaproteobacteria bacterium]
MSVRIIRAGLQTTIQAGPRVGLRHLGVPASGPADPLSMALANRLVGNSLLAPALEATLTGVDLRFEIATWFAISGAPSSVDLNGSAIDFLVTCRANPGDELHVGSATAGARAYVAVAGGFVADEILGSASTYLPAGFGGYQGRTLEDNDELDVGPGNGDPVAESTPAEFRPPISRSWALRACTGADIALLDGDSKERLFNTNFTIGNRADRMGLQLDGRKLAVASGGRLPSAPVFPGCIQCPENGVPFVLSVDAQTTGGYPRVAQIARADRHLLGQLRPGAHLRLLRRSPTQAIDELHEKHAYWRAWLPGVAAVI